MERVDPGGGVYFKSIKNRTPLPADLRSLAFSSLNRLFESKTIQSIIHVNSIKKETQYNFAKPTSRDIRREEDLCKQSLSSPRSPTEGRGARGEFPYLSTFDNNE